MRQRILHTMHVNAGRKGKETGKLEILRIKKGEEYRDAMQGYKTGMT